MIPNDPARNRSADELTVAQAVENLSRRDTREMLQTFKITGRLFDYEPLPAHLGSIAQALMAASVRPRFRQEDYAPVLLKWVSRLDLQADLEGRMSQLGGGILFHDVVGFTVAVAGQLPEETRQQAVACCEYALETDTRPREWEIQGWRERVWTLCAALFMAAYWLDDPGLAENVLGKAWFPKGKAAIQWDDVPKLWHKRAMDWLDFAFWRDWWIKRLGAPGKADLDLERFLKHALLLFGSPANYNVGMIEYFFMAHALWVGKPERTDLGEIMKRLMALEPKPWR